MLSVDPGRQFGKKGRGGRRNRKRRDGRGARAEGCRCRVDWHDVLKLWGDRAYCGRCGSSDFDSSCAAGGL